MTIDHFSQKELLIKISDKLDATHDMLIRHMASEESALINMTKEVSVLKEDVAELQIKHEGIATRVGTGVFVASSLFIYVLNKFL